MKSIWNMEIKTSRGLEGIALWRFGGEWKEVRLHSVGVCFEISKILHRP